MHQEIYVRKEDAAALPQWEDFVRYVYQTFPNSLKAEVMDLQDSYPFITFRELEGEVFVDAGNIPRYFGEGATEVTPEAFIKAVAPHLMEQPVKAKRSKRKKGPSRKAPTINKAKITFMSGESYTVKDFVSIEATADQIVFIMEDNWKGTVNYRQAITVPNDDVDNVVVRGIKDRFELDMALTNMGITILRSSNAEILMSELTITL